MIRKLTLILTLTALTIVVGCSKQLDGITPQIGSYTSQTGQRSRPQTVYPTGKHRDRYTAYGSAILQNFSKQEIDMFNLLKYNGLQ